MAGVGAVGGRGLDAVVTVGTGDEQGFARLEVMEALEGMDAAQGDPLPGTTRVAGVGDGG
jgi:hypothetical protein